MILALILLPAVAGLCALVLRADQLRRALLLTVAVVHAGMTATAWLLPPAASPNGWLRLDAPGLVFLSITSLLFLVAALYGLGYLRDEEHGRHADFQENLFFANAPEAVFIACLLFFLSTMTLVTVSHHLGLLWVAVEATTLSSAPLIYFHRHHRSLEATWKYLLICSVGIALALLGNFFLAAAIGHLDGHTPLLIEQLLRHADRIDGAWLKGAFVFLIVGYGTKMGLAPLHTWLPDAHSESPSLVSALLSGALLNCAFLAILRAHQICVAAGQGAFSQDLLVGFGLLSMAFAGVFVVRQSDYKRLLAYSSVEHMGILSLGVGVGGAATFGALFHAVNHSLTKAMLFLVAGNILAAYRTKATARVRGVLQVLPASGLLWVVGFLAITGSPPFGPFLSEFTILTATISQGRYLVAIAYLALLAVIFVGMSATVLRMAYGDGENPSPAPVAEHWLAVAPPAALGAAVLILGLYLPPAVSEMLHAAARTLGGL